MVRRWIRPSAWPRATAEVLYVVALPLLSEADDTALRRLRAQYHPREADLIGPHFTLVFGAPAAGETALPAAMAAIPLPGVWLLNPPSTPAGPYLYARPSPSGADLTEHYDALNSPSGNH